MIFIQLTDLDGDVHLVNMGLVINAYRFAEDALDYTTLVFDVLDQDNNVLHFKENLCDIRRLMDLERDRMGIILPWREKVK